MSKTTKGLKKIKKIVTKLKKQTGSDVKNSLNKKVTKKAKMIAPAKAKVSSLSKAKAISVTKNSTVANSTATKKVVKKVAKNKAKVSSLSKAKAISATKNSTVANSTATKKVVKKVAKNKASMLGRNKAKAISATKNSTVANSTATKKVTKKFAKNKASMLGHNKAKTPLIDTNELTAKNLVKLATNIVNYNNNCADKQQILSEDFKKDLKSGEAFNRRLVTKRIAGLDSLYSTNLLSRRHYVVDHLMDIFNRKDKDIRKKYENIISNIDNRHADHDFKFIFDNSIGIQKDLKGSGCAYSFLSKYGFFVTDCNFPVYDRGTKELLKNYFGCKVVNNVKTIDHLRDYFINIKNVCDNYQVYKGKKGYEVDYEKFDNFAWLFLKIERGNLATILPEPTYRSLISKLGLDIDCLAQRKAQVKKDIEQYFMSNYSSSVAGSVQKRRMSKILKKHYLFQDNYIFQELRWLHSEGKLETVLNSAISDTKYCNQLCKMLEFVIEKYQAFLKNTKGTDCTFTSITTKNRTNATNVKVAKMPQKNNVAKKSTATLKKNSTAQNKSNTKRLIAKKRSNKPSGVAA